MLLFFTSTIPGTDLICLIASSIVAGSTYCGFKATSTDEGEKLKPEEARGLLPNDIKTELCMTGYIEDFTYIPSEDTPEKAGFFSLRCAKDAHPDMQILANDLKQQFIDTGLYNLK